MPPEVMYMLAIFQHNHLFTREYFSSREDMVRAYKEWPYDVDRDNCSCSCWKEEKLSLEEEM